MKEVIERLDQMVVTITFEGPAAVMVILGLGFLGGFLFGVLA